MNRTVERLDVSIGGAWVVTTSGSKDIWDLESGLYVRIAGPRSESGAMEWDHVPLQILQVDAWPEVGGSFLLQLAAPESGARLPQRSSVVVSIQAIDADLDPFDVLAD